MALEPAAGLLQRIAAFPALAASFDLSPKRDGHCARREPQDRHQAIRDKITVFHPTILA